MCPVCVLLNTTCVTEDFAPGCGQGGQEQVLHCAPRRLKCERVMGWKFGDLSQCLISHRKENTELQLRGTLHLFSFCKVDRQWKKPIILFYYFLLSTSVCSLFDCTNDKRKLKPLLLNNTGADICHCIYCSIWQNLFYPGNLLSPCEHACFYYEKSDSYSVFHNQKKKTKKQLGQGKEGQAENLMSGDHQVCEPIRRERWLVIPLWREALCFGVLRPSILP